MALHRLSGAVAAVGEVEVGPGAGVAHAGAHHGAGGDDLPALPPVPHLSLLGYDELVLVAGSGRERLVALAVLRPQHVVVLAHALAGVAQQAKDLEKIKSLIAEILASNDRETAPVPSCRAPWCRTRSTSGCRRAG